MDVIKFLIVCVYFKPVFEVSSKTFFLRLKIKILLPRKVHKYALDHSCAFVDQLEHFPGRRSNFPIVVVVVGDPEITLTRQNFH